MTSVSPAKAPASPGRVAPTRQPSLACGLLISVATILLCLGGIEVIGYFWEQNTAQGPWGWPLVAARRLHLEKHGPANQPYYLFRPDEDYLWRGIPVHINSHGFRTEEFGLPKSAQTYRILNIGDSIVFGWEVNQKDTYGKQLEQRLNTASKLLRYEVINAGIPGWNLESEYNFLVQEGLGYQPDAVVLDITIVNDIYGGGPVVDERPSLFQWLRDNSYGWPFLTIQTRLILAQTKGPEAIPVLNPPKNADAYYPLDEHDPVWDKMWDIIAKMQIACQSRNTPFIIIAFPTALQVNNSGHPDVPQRAIAQRANTSGIKFVDLLPVYQKWCTDNGMNLCEGYQNKLFADVWMHPTEVGHRLATEQILNVFSELPQAD
jgi:hypothetical protein